MKRMPSVVLVLGRKIFSFPKKLKYHDSRGILLMEPRICCRLRVSNPPRQVSESNHQTVKEFCVQDRRSTLEVWCGCTQGTVLLNWALRNTYWHHALLPVSTDLSHQPCATVRVKGVRRRVRGGRCTYLVWGTHLTLGERGLWRGSRSASCCRGRRPWGSRWSCRTSGWARGSPRCPGRGSCSGTLCRTGPWSGSGAAGPSRPWFQVGQGADGCGKVRPELEHLSLCHLKASEETTKTVITRNAAFSSDSHSDSDENRKRQIWSVPHNLFCECLMYT